MDGKLVDYSMGLVMGSIGAAVLLMILDMIFTGLLFAFKSVAGSFVLGIFFFSFVPRALRHQSVETVVNTTGCYIPCAMALLALAAIAGKVLRPSLEPFALFALGLTSGVIFPSFGTLVVIAQHARESGGESESEKDISAVQ
jgi:hypothetical protein